MATMYEMIMDLPLFKGVGKDHVSYFLEKTNVDFHNYNQGEVIAEFGNPVRMVRFVISGEVNLIHPLNGIDISVEERSGFGKVLAADRLFGLSTGYPYKAVATTRTSILEFSKEQYISLLHSDRIYMLNFFNYLSLRAQRGVDCLTRINHGDIGSRLRQLVCVMTDPGAVGVVINGNDEAFSEYCCTTLENVRQWKKELMESGLAECDSDAIHIKSRRRFVDM